MSRPIVALTLTIVSGFCIGMVLISGSVPIALFLGLIWFVLLMVTLAE
jgi:hypothetical protein